MPTFTYKIQEGIFVTTDIEPAIWIEKYPVTVEEEILIKYGANLETSEGVLSIITPVDIIEVTEVIE